MATLMAVFSVLGLRFQEAPSQDIPRLIEKLRSDRIEERERAVQELRALGRAAIPELEKAARDADPEVGSRARSTLRMIRLKEMFGIDPKDLTDLPATVIVDWIERKTGRKFVLSAELGLANQRIRVPDALLDVSDGYSAGVEMLRLASLGVAPVDGFPGAVEIFPAALAAKKGLKVYKDAQDLPRANEMCTLLLRPTHLSARSVQAALINVVSFPQNCLSVEESGTLILSDYASVLRKCAEIMKALDASRGFRVSITILEGRAGKDPSVPEPFRSLKLEETQGGLNQFSLMGQAAARLERVIQGTRQGAGKTSLQFPGALPLVVEFEGSVRAAGGPTLERLVVRRDGERPDERGRLLETSLELKDEKWCWVGLVPSGKEGVSLVILARASQD